MLRVDRAELRRIRTCVFLTSNIIRLIRYVQSACKGMSGKAVKCKGIIGYSVQRLEAMGNLNDDNDKFSHQTKTNNKTSICKGIQWASLFPTYVRNQLGLPPLQDRPICLVRSSSRRIVLPRSTSQLQPPRQRRFQH